MSYQVRPRGLARALPIVLAAALSVPLSSIAQTVPAQTAPATEKRVKFADDAPNRYVVKEGDTLWGIAKLFLDEPWHWPLIWNENSEVANPHLIYPGDVLVVADGGVKLLRRENLSTQTVKLEPQVHFDSLANAIPTIPPNVIQPFLTAPLIVSDQDILEGGYVTVGVENNILMGKLSQFYARGMENATDEIYQLYRPQGALRDPDTDEVLGYEAMYLGDARMLRRGDPAKLELTHSTQEISPIDRLMPASGSLSLPYYFPHAPEHEVRGYILTTVNGVSEMGPYAIVSISLGDRDGIEIGHVMRINRHGAKTRDPLTRKYYSLPEESSGLLMVFRTFEKASYALVMTGNRSVNIGDVLITP